uniref:NXPE C-terminal domain-containing protein n=1 Tax=Denticeps clupeoides TaxID=299321 RepID=A0AAY4EL90_9TELE
MVANVSRYVPFFLFLALSAIVFLLRNIHTLEKWNCFQTVSTLSQWHNSLSTALRQHLALLHPEHNQTYCAHLGQEPSVEEALEERYLQQSIAWPEPAVPGLPLRQSSDPSRSYFVIQPSAECSDLSGWEVGGQLEVMVHMQNFLGKAKRHGGDFLLARLHSQELGAGVAGRVVDHRDGLYSVVFPLLWAGPAQVEVTLVHSSEAVAALRRLREERPDRVYFKSQYRSGFLSETTMCNLCLPANQQPLCNYTDPHTGEPWYCYKPKMLDCDTRIDHAKGGYKKHLLTTTESMLFMSSTIKAPIKAVGMEAITVLPTTESRTDWLKTPPSGYYYQGSWRPLTGVHMQQFKSPSSVVQCLKGKMVYMYGDSTVRQWFEYLNAFVPELKEFNLHSLKNVGPFLAVDSDHNIMLHYRCHGPPIRFSTVPTSELRYVFNELDGLPGGGDTVVVLSVWSHFSTFPVEVYVRRLRHIRRAVVRLLDRAPGTLVVVRSANPQKLDPEVSLYNSDWFSAQLDAVLRAMFKGLNVLLVDAWEMTLAHQHPHLLHPPEDIVRNMIDLFLSHVCPVKKKKKKKN